jgi:hypothetical protein
MKTREISLLIALLLLGVGLNAQVPTKAEMKALRKAERAELRRLQDSIWNARYEAQMQAQREEEQRRREAEQRRNANTLVVETTYATMAEAYDIIINALLDDGYIIAEKDKEYYTIKTEAKNAGLARYDLSFRIKEQDGKVYADISGRVHTMFILYGVTHQSADPIENKGTEESANKVGFRAMEKYAHMLSHTTIQYITR